MDTIEQEIKGFIAGERASRGLGGRGEALYPTEADVYRYLTDQLSERELEKMLNHLKTHPEDQALVVTARRLFLRTEEAEREAVPGELLQKVRSQAPRKGAALCPYCHKAITPFKRPLSRQRLLNFLWFVSGVVFFWVSYVIPRYFIQWVVLGALCVMKWIVDQKATKTQIMIYKALEGQAEKTRHLHRTDSHL